MIQTKALSVLSHEVQRAALAQFVNRYTGDHKPQWARKPMPNGNAYPLQFVDDAEWLQHTYVTVTKAGTMDKRVRSCMSYPTWPNNPELVRM